jgi:hypothetical protein
MCSIEKFIELALTLYFKRQQHRKLSWLDKDSDKDLNSMTFSTEHMLEKYVQSDQKGNKSEQVLQIIGHVVAESCGKKACMGVDNLWCQTLLYNKSILDVGIIIVHILIII